MITSHIVRMLEEATRLAKLAPSEADTGTALGMLERAENLAVHAGAELRSAQLEANGWKPV